jgi:hypothetical protein
MWDRLCDDRGAPRYRFRDGELDSTMNLRPQVWRLAGKRQLAPDEVVTMICHPSCLNPAHMRAITRAELLARTNKDRAVKAKKTAAVAETIRTRQAKITMDDARYIRSSDKTLIALAEELGVSFQLVSKIRRGEAWPEVAGNVFAGLGAR